jgi:hypothetical protein
MALCAALQFKCNFAQGRFRESGFNRNPCVGDYRRSRSNHKPRESGCKGSKVRKKNRPALSQITVQRNYYDCIQNYEPLKRADSSLMSDSIKLACIFRRYLWTISVILYYMYATCLVHCNTRILQFLTILHASLANSSTCRVVHGSLRLVLVVNSLYEYYNRPILHTVWGTFDVQHVSSVLSTPVLQWLAVTLYTHWLWLFTLILITVVRIEPGTISIRE